MRTERLTYFLAAVDHGSLRRAAAALDITQSSLSEQLTALEEDLDVPLLIRSRRGVTPTSAADILIPQMRALLKAENALLTEAARLTDEYSGTVRIGATPALASSVVGGLSSSPRAERPSVAFSLTEGPAIELLGRVSSGTVDFALVVAIPDSELPADIEVRASTTRRVGIIVTRSHRLADVASVTWDTIADDPIVTIRPDPGRPLAQIVARALPDARTAAAVDSVQRIVEIVGYGDTVGIVSEDTSRTLHESMVWVPLVDEYIAVHLVQKKSRLLSRAARYVRGRLVEVVESLGE